MDDKSVSIIGCCVCRDLFMNDDSFSFHTDIRFSSPISLIARPSKTIKIDFNNFPNKALEADGKWFKKTIINDVNKTAFQALKENHGKYLIIDFVEARMDLADINIGKNGERLTVTNSGIFKRQFSANLSKNVFKNCEMRIIHSNQVGDDVWKQTLQEFADKIRCIFDEKNIILIKTMPAQYYINKLGYLDHFSTLSHCSEIFQCQMLLPKLYDMFEKICPKITIINIPPLAIGDSNHKWKTNPFHFTQIYYSYLLECVKSITINHDSNRLKSLYNNYSQIFANEYNEAAFKTIEYHQSCCKKEFDYKDIIDSIEEFAPLGRKKRAKILFAISKKQFFKNLKRISK